MPSYYLEESEIRHLACIRGLRYPVETVLEWLAGGMSINEILADYGDLEREDILAVLRFTARFAHVKQLERLVVWREVGVANNSGNRGLSLKRLIK